MKKVKVQIRTDEKHIVTHYFTFYVLMLIFNFRNYVNLLYSTYPINELSTVGDLR